MAWLTRGTRDDTGGTDEAQSGEKEGGAWVETEEVKGADDEKFHLNITAA